MAVNTGEVTEFRGTPRFKVLCRLGAGGMGVVYEAIDGEQGTRVALKTLRSLTIDTLIRFRNEFSALKDIQHPNLVTLGELVEDVEQCFFTMELVTGVDFLAYVRPAEGEPWAWAAERLPLPRRRDVWVAPEVKQKAQLGFDESRLRASLAQLCRGLLALHAAGKVHRDVKPSNVLVTAEGRTVLLDFGLVTDVARDHAWGDVQVVGTTAYMAPEQAASKPVGPEADWYSVGVVLYVALTGHLPFTGAPLEVLMNKQRFEPPPPISLSAQIPADLNSLCVELLRFDPMARPSGRGVLRRLNVPDASDAFTFLNTSLQQNPPFVGRARELAALASALAQTRQGTGRALLLTGELGVGKSTLLKEFLRTVPEVWPDAVVLAGTCLPGEASPYNAVHGVIEELSLKLAKLDVSAILPSSAPSILPVFPVLRRVGAMADGLRPGMEAPDPQEQRGRVFAALRELFRGVAATRPVLLTVDDYQEADRDSQALLEELLQPPDAPALLLLCVTEAMDSASAPFFQPFAVTCLPQGEAKELASRILDRGAPAMALGVDAVAAETQGHPLYVGELCRHMMLHGGRAPERLGLDEILRLRIDALDFAARNLLELCAVAEEPLAQETATYALAVELPEYAKQVAVLRVAQLLRTSGPRRFDTIELSHPRVKDVVLSGLGDEAKKRHHRGLALALEGTAEANPELLSRHWQGADDAENAARYALSAATQAAKVLAFDRASRLYRLALDLRGEGPNDRMVWAKLGDNLAWAGRGVEAGEAYLRATRGATAAETLDLQRRAAEQFLRSGHFERGTEMLAAVLGAVGMTMPRTPRQALVGLVWHSAHLRLRGRRYRERDTTQISKEDLTRVDIAWLATIGLGMFDLIRGAEFQARHMLVALRSGEMSRVARAITIDNAMAILRGLDAKRRDKLAAEAWALASRVGSPHAIALARMTLAMSRMGLWKSALEACDEAETLFRERCQAVTWELCTTQLFALWALYYLGEIAELSRRLARLLREAERRGDLYTATTLRSVAHFSRLAADDPDGARREAAEAVRLWSPTGFYLQHYFDLIAHGDTDLYTGQGRAAWQRLEARWPAVSGSLLMYAQSIRVSSWDLRARTALAGAASEDPGATRRALARIAEQCVQRLLAEDMPWSRGLAWLNSAGALAVRGQSAGAQRLLSQAAAIFDSVDMVVYAAVARCRLGQLVSGDEGQALVKGAEEVMRRQGVKNPARMADMIAPGYHE